MRGMLSRINVPTAVAVLVFIAIDRQFDVTGKALNAVGLTPAR